MSRIAKKPIIVPLNINIVLKNNKIIIKNNTQLLEYYFNNSVIINYEHNILSFKPKLNQCYDWMQTGTVRSVVNSMIIGLTVGFEKTIQLVGVGYRVSIEKNNNIIMSLGYSHIIRYILPHQVQANVLSPTELLLKSINKQLLGQVASDLRKQRKPECYKGKGVRYLNEKIVLKEAKKK